MAGEKQTMAPPNTNITRQLYFQVVAIVAVGFLFIVRACKSEK